MPAVRTTIFFLLLLAGGGCAYLRPAPSDGTGASAVRDLTTVRQVLQAADADSAHLLLTRIGRVNAVGLDAPIWRMTYRPFQPDLKQVLVLAGIHGNEAAGVDCVLGLIRRLRATPGPDTRFDMDILPLVNPWGWVHDRPLTPAGVDIAMDFNAFDSQEARIIRRFLREKRYDLVLDLREDPTAKGFYLRQYGMGDTDAALRTVERIRAAGHPIEPDARGILFNPRNGVAVTSLWGLKFWRLTRQLTIAGYIRQSVCSSVFTVVTPTARPLPERIAMQQAAVETLLAELAAPTH